MESTYYDFELHRANNVELHMQRLRLRGKRVVVVGKPLTPEGFVQWKGQYIAAKAKDNQHIPVGTIVQVVTVHAGILQVDWVKRPSPY